MSDLILNNYEWQYKDLYNYDFLKYFYEAQEAIYLFLKSTRLNDKRRIEGKILDILLDFINYKYSNEDIGIITLILKSNNKIIFNKNEKSISLNTKLKTISLEGYKLLGINDEEEVDITILKSLYRFASKKYHPDKGGTNEEMKIINEAYSKFFNFIANNLTININTEDEKNYNYWNEFLFSVYLTICLIYGDFYDIKNTIEYLNHADVIAKERNIFFNIIQYYLNNPLLGYGFIETPINLFRKLNMEKELLYVKDKITEFVKSYINISLQRKTIDKNEASMIKHSIETLIVGNIENIKIYTIEQAKNLLLINKIDDKKYNEVKKRITKKDNENIDKINNFIDKIGFVQLFENEENVVNEVDLPMWHNINDNKINKQNINKEIPYPSFDQHRYCLLSEDQKQEYKMLFSKKQMGYLFNKYYNIRVNEILIALIKRYKKIDIEYLQEEINFFSNNFNNKFDKYNLLKYFLENIKQLDIFEREKKFNLLSEMDYLTGFANDDKKNIKRKIFVDSSYINFALSKYKKILEYNKDIFDYDLFLKINDIIDNMNKSDVGKKYLYFLLKVKNPEPENVINTSEQYIKLVLDTANNIIKNYDNSYDVSNFGIGYIINRLTTACSKIKNWEKVIYWTNFYFNLPEQYRLNSSVSETKAIVKRMEKAKSMI